MSDAAVKLSLIVARSRNGVIGRDGDLPWHLKSDLKHFIASTKGKPIIMGRKTWDSLPRKPLPKRMNIVVSRDTSKLCSGGWIFPSLESAIAAAKAEANRIGNDEVFVTGGAQLYALSLPFADKLYLTDVDIEIDGDTHFPEFDESEWREDKSERVEASEDDDHAFTIRWLSRASQS